MSEVRQLTAGEAILGEAATFVQPQDARTRDTQTQEARNPDSLLEDLVRQHARLVYRIAYAALRSHHDAEDAAQETFLRVMRFRHRIASVDDPKSWIARIAWRVAVERNRQRGRRRETAFEDTGNPVAEVASFDASADELLHSRQTEGTIEKLITALPAKLRDPLILSAIEEMSPREVAAALGINEAAVRSRIFRARRILQEKFAAKANTKTAKSAL